MRLSLYRIDRIDRIVIAQYLFILGTLILFKFKITSQYDKCDPYVVLFLYYLGVFTYSLNIT